MAREQIRPVVLCGGSGTRLWPLSTASQPKQFLSLLGNRTMLQVTLDRVSGKSDNGLEFTSPLVIGSQQHNSLLQESAKDTAILLEPCGRNSAAPVAAAALSSDPDDLLLVLPADHDISDVAAFHEAILKGASAAREGAIVTFGIIPTMPATGYGYIEVEDGEGGVRDARRFVEKPDRETAKAYLESGGFFWNAGIFLFRAGDMLAAFSEHAADILDDVSKALPEKGSVLPGKVNLLDAAAFEGCRSQSVDFAIMEKVSGLKVVPVEMGWSDIGDFRALWERSDKDDRGNSVTGEARLEGCTNCYVHVTGQPVSLGALNDAAVIVTQERIMICGLDGAQTVKKLAD